MDHYSKFGIKIFLYSWFLVQFVYGIHFQFPETDPCEIIDIDATFSLRYDDGSGQSEDAPIFSLDGALVHNQSSSCDDPDLDHLLNFDLHPSGERLSLNFQINGTNGDVTLFVYFRMDPSKHFKDLNESSVIMSDSTHLPVGDSGHSYRCISEQIISFNNDSFFYMNMTIGNVQLQAYNVNGSSYSPSVECSLDMVTTEEPTSEMTSSQTQETTSQEPMTSMPTSHIVTSSPTEPPNPRLHFEVKNGSIVCLVLDGVFSFMITYMKKDNTTENAVIAVPQDAVSYASSCGVADRQFLQILFFNTSNKPWSFDINIQKSDKTEAHQGYAADGDVTYSWKNVGLTYYMDSHFEGAKDTSGDVKGASSGDLTGTFQATSSGSYKCDKEQNIGMGNITLIVSQLQYRAFGTTKNDKYPTENVVDCSSPGKKDDTGKMIGIIVGSLCGGIVLIAFVVYLLVRYKKRKSYSELKEPL